ncbi:cytochrome c biogenesis protein CcsA [Terriglobus aquaticus]|uniref:Heme exporter protein C n=1 Tax=Terriglobus aquaticus TaxID=940139 RepID=A0ABW9KKJ2_9BACT|nr:cytochrome c biogenesis protein CcsA [Terriglobus aquaticus]
MKRLFYLCAGLAVALLAFSTYRAWYVAPTEATMGPVQRIFYWHVPLFIVGEVTPYVNMLASLGYLYFRSRNTRLALQADALAVAAAEVTTVFVGLGLVAGILWGRPAWGIWWAWDARTTSTLLLWLLYVSYLLARRFSSDESSKTLGAVLSIFAGVNVPIVFMSIRWWRTQHPAPVLTGDGYLDPSMKAVLGWNILAFFVWGTVLVWARYAILRVEQQTAEHRLHTLLEREAV